jgi:hypothetical protein
LSFYEKKNEILTFCDWRFCSQNDRIWVKKQKKYEFKINTFDFWHDLSHYKTKDCNKNKKEVAKSNPKELAKNENEEKPIQFSKKQTNKKKYR